MKRRFRYYFRQGWHSVKVERANLWNVQGTESDFGDQAHFDAMNAWCEKSFPKDAWVSRFFNPMGGKEFAFKEPKYASWFRLKWL
jgi:hypothetical protein